MDNKLPTLKEIARRLKFSVSTVSRALHDHPSIGLRTKMQVKQLAKELNYEPNQTALFFKQQKTHTIGVILPNLKEEFFSQAINGIEDVAKINKYSVLIGQSHDDIDQEKQIAIAMKNQRVDGLIVSISKHTKNYDHFISLRKYNIPVVFFDRVPDLPTVHKVASNFNTGTKQAIEFLITKGHRRIGVINGPEEMKSSKERIITYMEVLQKKRIKIDLSLIVTTDLTQVKTFEAMKNLLDLKYPPTAILTINDYVALDAIQYARKSKLKINKDISFVSYANLPIINYLEFPPLASVEQYPYEQAKKATEILFDLFNADNIPDEEEKKYHNILIEGQLIIHKK
ncbi:LacI family transcriptional regulator [Ginsengibacter hankyongi]|uniref:LacI family transcriptional regulator n=1 Tax=Ginsengibacter hankyongi TaxID=2607284 RepID=A0A5J5IC86_9BACT|nr:LacI family DNA-binding transcriptional regulator [Ginsengibacter hankyongi]KAA9036281.1 LacI family transcriptional regulator [Ginsengibacter hankyongi]